ncbi:MAG: ABC transporter substrate-binding protein [Bacteroidetes bacterium]|nr:ABC transporter substrate-binding protein [Bacteroidota bacterium]
MQKKFIVAFILSLCFFGQVVKAQDEKTTVAKTHKIGIFAPLYLDSVFAGNSYRYGKNFPRFMVQSLDFVQGAQIAADSITLPGTTIKIYIYDSKAADAGVSQLIEEKKIDSLDCIIGSVRDEDYIKLASFALEKNIPFISATYPNDGGITGNPFLVIMNSTLRAHCEAIYAYLLQSHGTDKILLCRKPGTQEDRVAGYFKKINEPDGKPLLNIQTVNIADSNFAFIKNKMDSTKKNVIIGASLDEYFAFSLSSQVAYLNKTYPATLIGMPNWDGFKSFAKKNNMGDFPVYYTTPYYNSKSDSISKMIQSVYLKKYKGVPSDFTYKGFEITYLLLKTIAAYPDDFMNHLNDSNVTVFNEYNFKPVFNSSKAKPDYFENKHLYFMKNQHGKISKAW